MAKEPAAPACPRQGLEPVLPAHGCVRALQNGSNPTFWARLSQAVPGHWEKAGVLQSRLPAVPVSAASPSLSGMLRLRRSQRRTDLSWPKNTVNILGSVLCSLMVQDANTPKPTRYTQSLAPKENTVFAPHEKLDLHPKPRRGTSGAEGYWWMARKKKKRAQMYRARHVLPAEPPRSKTHWGAGRFRGRLSIPPPILISSWSRVRAALGFLWVSLPNPHPRGDHSCSWCRFPSPRWPVWVRSHQPGFDPAWHRASFLVAPG